ncbi:MAG TPA: DUF4159 domain-containing protein [Polyangiaceae bacterium]
MADRRFRLKRPFGTGALSRRAALASFFALGLGSPWALAFGQAGAFHPRLLKTGGSRLDSIRTLATSRWSWELVRRTSAPARLATRTVAAEDPQLLAEPFVIWAGEADPGALSAPELRGLERFLKLGGVLLVDDANPAAGAFVRGARREIQRILPEAAPVRLDPGHVLFKTYFIVDRPVGRVLGPAHVDAIVRGKNAQVLYLSHDLLGALARSADGGWAFPTEPAGVGGREQAIRFAVNIGMYVLCSDYKDDQVHAPWLMRRRAGRRP